MISAKRILVVEADSSFRTALFRFFQRKGHQAVTAISISEAKKLLQTDIEFHLGMISTKLPDGDSQELMQIFKSKFSSAGLVAIENKNMSLEEMERLTSAYLFTEPVVSIAQKSPAHKLLQVIGESDSIREVFTLVEKVADSESTVLITGESGTGKELIARAIHQASSRKDEAFVAINCGAIPTELLESELFGHIKGAFTGAIQNRVGRFELADGGTLFLDEIGDLAPSLQVKILRALQEKAFEPVGSTKTLHVDVRLIAATNVNLEKAVEENKFREDLYYRLNVIPLQIPSLRERKTDIPILLRHFVEKFAKTRKKKLTGFSSDAMDYLVQYQWPGNIRELENLVERMSILKGEGSVEVLDLPTKYRAEVKNENSFDLMDLPESGLDFNSAVDAYENALILRALEKTGWNRNQAALLLKLNRTTLVEKIKKKGLKPSNDMIDLGN